MDRRSFLKFLGFGGATLGATVGVGRAALVRHGGSQGEHDHGASEAAEGPAKAEAAGAVEEDEELTPFMHRDNLRERGEGGLFPNFPGPTGKPGQLDRLLYPPPARPAKPGRVREYDLEIVNRRIEIAKGIFYEAWTFNGHVPGPIIRATVGDRLRVRLRNKSKHPHSIHWHGVHPARQDGVFELVPPGKEFTYEFTVEPFGLFPYHCHMEPLDQHISRGLYGAMIIDPPTPRPPAKELVMVMNGYDLNFDEENEIYSVNGIGNYYVKYPIRLKVGEPVRIYLVNMTEFDPVNSLHIHANMFQVYRSGTSLAPNELTDIVTLGIAERAIVEFTYKYPGRYMFHAHQTEIGLRGWMGHFEVVE